MQLILLSGGSGKRLWPLSNAARSKQFLPLLENEQGILESMLQRVVRQVYQSNLTDSITIATNVGQLDVITKQLGDTVSVVTEPERRDTFPAIALAVSFLKYEKKCNDEEVVVVMPSDPFTELEYFATIKKMEECISDDVADLVLMGISPTYPSEKFGYIVPHIDKSSFKIDKTYRRVAHFTEKPSVDKAKELISENAFWNGGVFAFRLDYMMNIINKYIISESFDEIRSRYSEFPKISFDYEVVEKAESVAVVPFKGEWKDLGTWNTFTGEIRSTVIGRAIMGGHCENTHIINELSTPIYVDGTTNVIVAACQDGILVCDKEYSEDIKTYIENLNTRPMYEEKCWGSYTVLDDNSNCNRNKSLTKRLTVLEGNTLRYASHRYRSEVWIILSGKGVFVLGGLESQVNSGDILRVPVGIPHAIRAITQLSLIEIQMGEILDESDFEIHHYNWK